MDGKISETTLRYAEKFKKFSTKLAETHAENIELGTKLINCLQRLDIRPKLPDVRQLLGSGMTSQRYTLADVKEHCELDSCWIVLHDKVYDVTDFLISHPGGEEIILENAGTDATVPFDSKGHSADAVTMLEQYCIGALVERDRRL